MTGVLVVEDQRALADALHIAIDAQPDLACVAVASTVIEAVRLLAEHPVDVVLMDVHLPGPNGIEGTRRIKAADPSVRVLILTADNAPHLFADATAAGADGFLAKDSPLPDILAAIRTPADKTIPIEGATLAALLKGREHAEEAPRAAWGENWAHLTVREQEVLGLMGEGLDPGTIAERLAMSPHTSRGHVKSVMAKLSAHSQLEAVIVAIRTGILPVPPAPRGHR
jgi:DNA-binding NarL/FixJ family response regulator